MRLYKPKYRNKHGKVKEIKKWHIEFRDLNGVVQRWSLGITDERVAETVRRQINLLNEWAKQGLPPPKDLIRWAQHQKRKLYDNMYSAGILGNHNDYNYKQPPKSGKRLEQLKSYDIPFVSGIYFIFNSNKVVYVGKSKNLKSRIKGSHGNIVKGDSIAWLEFPVRLLNFAESYYIGICKPERNFGGYKKGEVNYENENNEAKDMGG